MPDSSDWAAARTMKRGGKVVRRAGGGDVDRDDQFPPERGDDRLPLPRRPDYADPTRTNPRPVIDLSDKLGKYKKGGAVKKKGKK